MATDAENLATRRSAILAELAAMDPTKAGGKPNASGQSINVDHAGYKKGLYDELKQINETLTAVEGAFEVTSEGQV